MSGGHFDYAQHRIFDVAEQLRSLRENGEATSIDWEEPEKVLAALDETIALAERCAFMVKQVDYLWSGDHGEATFLENIREYKQQSGIITSAEG